MTIPKRKQDRSKSPKKSRKVQPKHQSWLTTDEQEIERRRQRALTEPMMVEKIGGGKSVFADYTVWRTDQDDPRRYTVELRSLERLENSCDCFDYRKNRLGTCKHIEKVVARAAGGKVLASPMVEVFLDHQSDGSVIPRVKIPPRCPASCQEFIGRYLGIANSLKKPVCSTLSVMMRHLRYTSESVRSRIRVSSAVREYVESYLHEEKTRRLRETCAEELRRDAGQAAFLHHPLYDYQIDGMLHLAFTGRALLADEMGLGKTVQAIAAARVLRDLHDIGKTLVVSPASLKAEWEDQIAKFTDLPCEVVLGGRKERLHMYRESKAFFLLANYEQIIRDWREINDLLQPDLVILDEAQRIKNWRTKTARHIKDLNSRFAFVLTGTPLENRIDELYSLVEFIDPTLFGSLYLFNRRFYKFNEEGKTAGFKNLSELHKTVSKVMLRRRKDQIQEQLPERIDNNYFVPMTTEQDIRYEDHAVPAARLMHTAKSRPLTPAEHQNLQLHLASMRMLCDSCYILDSKITDSPKADELRKILADIRETDPDRKIIVFSEWVRMLELVQADLDEDGIGYAVHTGKVPQKKRRDEIKRFKEDPDCAVFLSTDSGGVGLNLQNASVVINLDLPWNPAKLEQRIARAWRKHQKNTVNVINLIAEGTIEQRMLGTLSFKQGLADAVLDARGDMGTLEQPDSRSQFMERLANIMDTKFSQAEKAESDRKYKEDHPSPKTLLGQLAEDLSVTAAPELESCAAVKDEKGNPTSVFAVTKDTVKTKAELEEAVRKVVQTSPAPAVMVVDTATQALLNQLAKAGIITINNDAMEELVNRKPGKPQSEDRWKRRRTLVEPLLGEAQRKLRMASVLDTGGFAEEAAVPALQAGRLAGRALLALSLPKVPETLAEKLTAEDIGMIAGMPNIDAGVPLFLNACLADSPPLGTAQFIPAARKAVEEAQSRLLAPSSA